MSSGRDDGSVGSKVKQAVRVLRARRRIAEDSDSEDAPTSLPNRVVHTSRTVNAAAMANLQRESRVSEEVTLKERAVASETKQAVRVLRARRRIADDSDSEDGQTSLPKRVVHASRTVNIAAKANHQRELGISKEVTLKHFKGIWRIVLSSQGDWGEARISDKASYLFKAGATRGVPLKIDGDGSSESPFSIGAAVLVKSEGKSRVWRWPNGDESRWTQIASEVHDIKSQTDQLQGPRPELPEPPRKKLKKPVGTENESNVANLPRTYAEDVLADSDAESEDDIGRESSPQQRKVAHAKDSDYIAVSASKNRRQKVGASKPQVPVSDPSRGEDCSDADEDVLQPAVRGVVDELAESNGESSGSDWQPVDRQEGTCPGSGSALPDVTQDTEVPDWQRDLESRRASSTEPRSSFSTSTCSRKDIRQLQESSFLGGRPIFDFDGRVNVNLLSVAYYELALKPETCHEDTSARHILWLASLANALGMMRLDRQKRSRALTKRKHKKPEHRRSPDRICLHADDFELRFPTRPTTMKKKGKTDEGDEFFSDGEDAVEHFKRRRKVAMELVEKNKASQAKITSQSSSGLNLEDVCKTLTAPTLSFDWDRPDPGDDLDVDEGTLEVCIPEDKANRNSRRELLKNQIQQQVSRRLAERLLPKQAADCEQLTGMQQQGLQPCSKASVEEDKTQKLQEARNAEEGEEQQEEEDEEVGGIAVASCRRKRVLLESRPCETEECGEEKTSKMDQTRLQEVEGATLAATPTVKEGLEIIETSTKPSCNTKSDSPKKSNWPAWVLKLQAVGVANPSMPEMERLATSESRKDASHTEQGKRTQAQDRRFKQTLLLDMFRRSFSGIISSDHTKSVQCAEALPTVASCSPPERVPHVWEAALQGAFPALRHLRRLKHVAPQDDDVRLCSESEEEISSDENSDIEELCSEQDSAHEDVEAVEEIRLDSSEDDRQEAEEEQVQTEEVLLSAEDYRRHREMLRLKRQQARKLQRKLRWEVEDIAEIRNEVERMISFGMATMTEEDQKRWRELVGAAFIDVPSMATVQMPRARAEDASCNATGPSAAPPSSTAIETCALPVNGRRLFGGRADDEGNDLYTLAAPVRQRASFLKGGSARQQATAMHLANKEVIANPCNNDSFSTLKGGFHQQELARRLSDASD